MTQSARERIKALYQLYGVDVHVGINGMSRDDSPCYWMVSFKSKRKFPYQANYLPKHGYVPLIKGQVRQYKKMRRKWMINKLINNLRKMWYE